MRLQVKSMDRNHAGYLLMAFYGDQAWSYAAPLAPLRTHCFTPVQVGGSFKDHDDSNLIWSRGTQQWVDMQIFAAPWLLPNGSRTVCPHNLSDNGGCDGGPRSITVRTSKDGRNFSGDWGCQDPPPFGPQDPVVRNECKVWNETALIRPHPTEDPPEMEFYRIRPFCKNGRAPREAVQACAG